MKEITFNDVPSVLAHLQTKIDEVLKYVCHQPVNETENKPIGLDEAAKILMVSRPTLYRYCSQRRIPHYKVKKKLYFLRSDLLKFIKEGRKKTTTEIDSDLFPSSPSK